jgi:hypothetical protein
MFSVDMNCYILDFFFGVMVNNVFSVTLICQIPGTWSNLWFCEAPSHKHIKFILNHPIFILVGLAVAFKSREDHRKQIELEEARKAGLAPAEVDEDGKEINPHIPQYMSSAPWYLNAERPVSRFLLFSFIV